MREMGDRSVYVCHQTSGNYPTCEILEINLRQLLACRCRCRHGDIEMDTNIKIDGDDEFRCSSCELNKTEMRRVAWRGGPDNNPNVAGFMGCGVYNSRIIVGGGLLPDLKEKSSFKTECSDALYEFRPINRRFCKRKKQKQPLTLPSRRGQPLLFEWRDRLYALYGAPRSIYSLSQNYFVKGAAFDFYDAKLKTWIPLPRPPKPDYPHKSYAIFDDKLYVQSCHTGVFCFDLVTNQWSQQPISLAEAFVCEGKIIALPFGSDYVLIGYGGYATGGLFATYFSRATATILGSQHLRITLPLNCEASPCHLVDLGDGNICFFASIQRDSNSNSPSPSPSYYDIYMVKFKVEILPRHHWSYDDVVDDVSNQFLRITVLATRIFQFDIHHFNLTNNPTGVFGHTIGCFVL
ncbi:hypothetical protein CCACVL1_12219 [Corchorus capsularis]|uniref:Uncharacterized protein n=1 Tax=Corchorus capsularis TaxID=210143 RepID=A0A1R3IGU0_COCAP|nr:hypothetical protein CCACVL1_12219 [Corchorus capsularis]